jgi:CDP-diacylglycerol--glycerol-3-phosphate 3-phosphatidyltransferase
MNVPNLLTITRILAIPVLIIVLLSQFKGREIVGFAIFLLAASTDILDGMWARRKNQVTTIGKLLDPIADKLLVAAALICLVELGTVASWMAIVLIGRGIAVTGLRAIASSQSHHIQASRLGKIKMWVEAIAISLLILGSNILGSFYILAQIGLWLAIAVSVISGTEYFLKFRFVFASKDS